MDKEDDTLFAQDLKELPTCRENGQADRDAETEEEAGGVFSLKEEDRLVWTAPHGKETIPY